MSEFLDNYTGAFEVRMEDTRFDGVPTMTVWIIPKGDDNVDNRRLLVRMVFVRGESDPNLLLFRGPDGEVVWDTTESGAMPKDFAINTKLNELWDGDPNSQFMDIVGEMAARVFELMNMANFVASTGGEKTAQQAYYELSSIIGMNRYRGREDSDGNYHLEEPQHG